MRVTRLEVFGFKSFMDRLILPLEGGVTAVVGPNGCGKSNIVDALRWVLGETRASNLRGEILEDIIFNGTDKLRPLGLAEVTVTVRSAGENFFADLSAPALEAEDLVAAADKTLQDVAADLKESSARESLAESGDANGADSDAQQADRSDRERPRLTVIQGNLGAAERVEREISADLEVEIDAAELLDVGGAISGDADDEAVPDTVGSPVQERRAVPAGGFLSRFTWLQSVNEVQVTRRLYRSGESEFFINRVPCRLKDMKDLFRAIGLGARTHTIVAQGEVGRIVSAKPEERRLIIEEAAGVLGFRDKIAAAERRLGETAHNIARLDDIINEVSRQVSGLKRQAMRARDRQSLKNRMAELDAALFVAQQQDLKSHMAEVEGALAELRQREERMESRLQHAQALERDARDALMAADVAGDQIRIRIDALREQIGNHARQRGEQLSRLNELRAYCRAIMQEDKRLQERLDTLAQRRREIDDELIRLAEQDRALIERITSVARNEEEQIREIGSLLDNLREKFRDADRRGREIRDQLIGAQTALQHTEDQIVASAPVEQLKKSFRAEDGARLRELAGDSMILAEGIRTSTEYAKALQAVLGERAEFIVTKDAHALARAFVEQRRAQEESVAKNMSLGVVQSHYVRADHTAQLRRDVPLTPLLEKLEVLDNCRAAAEQLLGAVFISDTIEDALQFFAAASNGDSSEQLVIVTKAGEIVTAHSYYSMQHEGGIVQLLARAEQLKERVRTLDQDQRAAQAQRESAQEQVRLAEQRQAELVKESQARQQELRELNNQQGNIGGKMQALKRLSDQIDQDVVTVEGLIKESAEKLAGYHVEEQQVQDEIASLKPEEERVWDEELKGLNSEYGNLDGARREKRQELSDLANALDQARREIDGLRASFSTQALEQQKVALEIENLNERFRLDHGADLLAQCVARLEQAGAHSDKDENQRIEMAEELARIRARIQREGDVDPAAIEAFEVERQRLDHLEAQRRDLGAAEATLRRTIAMLSETSQRRFVSTFKAVRKNFSELIPRVFNGGKGDLELLDPAEPLNSGIEIIVRPPGKKLRSIDLLSGGEKALAATALIFAMFIERPSPLCVLDELDAPLDDANLVRLLALIKEMSARTQFLMITHNKQSMTTAHNLIGVTMQEPGASKVISISLQEAYSQVA